MSIQALPSGTSRLLSSSQVLTSPASVVKELIDNALDARATSIEVFISANTLDRIEVRDNGHGIVSDDLRVLGKRGYTSKLRHFNELKTVGGMSLGFRGEALASAVELAKVSIITRTEGDAVAIAVTLKADGGTETQSSVSHPIGTTVCVANLFSRLPVRKQNALKDIKKTILRVKELLQSYALAKLNVRLNFKIQKAGKSIWSFAPRPNGSIKEVVSEIVGRDTANQCLETIYAFPIPSPANDGTFAPLGIRGNLPPPPLSGFVAHAFLLRPGADVSKLGNGQYVSIDSRPVSCNRGTLKKILSIYKGILLAQPGGSAVERKPPFIRLNIVCPAGSYDPNIEPTKDNVLFEDESTITSMFEAWFKNLYGNKSSLMDASRAKLEKQYGLSMKPVTESGSLNFLRIPSAPHSESPEDLFADKTALESATSSSPRSTRNRNVPDIQESVVSLEEADFEPTDCMNAKRAVFDLLDNYNDEENREHPGGSSSYDAVSIWNSSAEEPVGPPNSLNPWVIAKLSTPIAENRRKPIGLVHRIAEANGSYKSKSILEFSSPQTTYSFRSPAYIPNITPVSGSSVHGTAQDEHPQRSLEEWLNQSGADRQAVRLASDSRFLQSEQDGTEVSRDQRNVAMAKDSLYGIPWSPPPSGKRAASNALHKPFISPLRSPQTSALKFSPMGSDTTVRCRSSGQAQPREISNDGIYDRDFEEVHQQKNLSRIAVKEALDFERRKEIATRSLRGEIRRSQISAVSRSARNTGTAISLQANQKNSTAGDCEDEEKPTESRFPDGDPRAYQMRRQQSTERSGLGRRSRRKKTMLLPLESIPQLAELHSLRQVVHCDTLPLCRSLSMFAVDDDYVRFGKQAMSFKMSKAEVLAIEQSSERIITGWMQVAKGERYDILFDFGFLRGKSTTGA